MFRVFIVTAALVLAALISAGRSEALLDPAHPSAVESDYELIVVEIDNCIYCGLFRRDVLPTYRNSQRARFVPLRFVDLNAPDVEKLSLTQPIDSVPTVLVVRHGQEVGRVAGYVGPENFFHAIERLLPELP